MLVSTKGRYALRTMMDLAVHSQNGPVKIKDIASRQEISSKYLEQIISILAREGLVRSLRGNQGGYYLSKEPYAYTVGEILRAAEGSLAPVDCLRTPENQCSRKDDCAALKLWEELDKAIGGVVDHYTLEDVLKRQQEKSDR